MINKINFIYNEPAMLGSGYMATRGLAEAFKRIGVLHYAYNTTGKEFLDQEALRAYPIFYIRGFLPGRGPMVTAGGDQFKATLQSESFFTRHGKVDSSSTHIREREKLFDVMFTIAETDLNLYNIPTYWVPSWGDINVLDHVSEPIYDQLGFVGQLAGREDWFRQDKNKIVKHHPTVNTGDVLENARLYTKHINDFSILVAPPGRMFNGMTGRAFEIMACKRLCLCYLNEDTMFKHMELFKDGEDLVYWHTFEEMIEKFNFYKNNPVEAQRIANNGYLKVREYHNQDVRAKFFADTVLKLANEKAGYVYMPTNEIGLAAISDDKICLTK